jgi:hypothetical protein
MLDPENTPGTCPHIPTDTPAQEPLQIRLLGLSHTRPQVNEALSLLERQAELSRSTPALPMDDKSELATLRLGAAAASRCRAENAELVERVR